MKKKMLVASGLSLMMVTGASITTYADDNDKLHENLDDISDVLEAVEIAREKFGGVIQELQLDSDDGTYKYEFEMKNESQEFELDLDAISLDVIKEELDDEDDDLDDKYQQKLDGDLKSFEEAYEATREFFDGSYLKDFEVEEDDDEVYYEFKLINEYLELEIDLYAHDLSVKDYSIEGHDDFDDLDHLKEELSAAIKDYDENVGVDDRDDDDHDDDDHDDDDDNDDDNDNDDDDDNDDD